MVKLDSRNFSRVIFFAILTTILLGVFYYIFFGVTELHLSGSDFVSYLTGGQILKKGEGELIYNIKSQTAYQKDVVGVYAREVALPFKALPFVGLFFIPFTLFPVLVGYRLFAILNFFLLLGFTLYSKRIFKRIKTFSFWFMIPFVFLSSVSVIIQGQISFFLSFLVLLLFLSNKTKKGYFSGILSGLLLIKPQYIVALPFFFVLAKDKRRFIYGFGLSFILLLFLSIYLSGFETLFSYPSFLLATETPLYGSHIQDMFTLNSTLYLIPFVSSLGYQYSLALNGVFYIFALYLFAKKQKLVKPEYSFIAATLFFLIFAVHAQIHDLSILLVAIFILLNEAAKKDRSTRMLILLALILFIMPFVISAISPPLGTFIGIFVALFLIGAVPSYARIKNAR